MTTSKKGYKFIKQEEGLKLDTYSCHAGVPTIGWGHTGKEVKKGMKISLEKAEAFLKNDIRWCETVIRKYVKIDLKQHEYDALISFIFNEGFVNFKNSTLLKMINKKAPICEIEYQFSRWIYGGGRILPILQRRRRHEIKLYTKGVY